jgi:antitoxin MazE
MQTQVKKWGNSLALRIPKAFAEEIAISSDSPVEISIVDGALVVVPIPEPQLSLEELLAEVSEDNLHHEVETGVAVGNEVW